MTTRHWLYLFLLWSALAWASFAAQVSFEWDSSPDVSVTGYRLYIGTNATFTTTNAVATINSGSNNATWTNALTGCDYWAFVTATNGLESDPSNVIQFRVPVAPGTLRIRLSLQSAGSVEGPWTPEGPCVEIEAPVDGTRFYRGWVAMERL